MILLKIYIGTRLLALLEKTKSSPKKKFRKSYYWPWQKGTDGEFSSSKSDKMLHSQ